MILESLETTAAISDANVDSLSDNRIEQVLGAGADVVKLARSFIDIDSVSGNEQIMASAISAWLESRGWYVEKQVNLMDWM